MYVSAADSHRRRISRRTMLACLASAGCAAGALVHAAARRAFAGGEATRDFGDLPAWVTLSDASFSVDIDGDGAPERVRLRDGRVVVSRGDATAQAAEQASAGADDQAGEGAVLFASPEDWRISHAFAADFNRDGACELLLLGWRYGNYGTSRPFWAGAAEGNDDLTQHLFLYGWRPSASSGELRSLWVSSQLGMEAAAIEVLDPDTRPRLRITATDGRETVWEWSSWGFALVEDEGDGEASPFSSAQAEALASSSVSADGVTEISLIAVGDNIAHANILRGAYNGAMRTYDFSSLFTQVSARIKRYDLAAVCQETILVSNLAQASSYPTFATPQAMGDALAQAGFSIVCAATNHANDQGPQAIDETVAFWAAQHPEVTLLGLHATAQEGCVHYLDRAGARVALVDFTYGLNGHNLAAQDAYRVDVLTSEGQSTLLASVAEARQQASACICFLHIGEEYQADPPVQQQRLIERLIDAGATAVICSHTHVLGPWGTMRTSAGNEGAVYYGLGNFVSGQADSIDTVLGGAAHLRLRISGGEATLVSCELLPVVCHTSVSSGSVSAYFLDDYTDELAADHVLAASGVPFTPIHIREAFATWQSPTVC